MGRGGGQANRIREGSQVEKEDPRVVAGTCGHISSLEDQVNGQSRQAGSREEEAKEGGNQAAEQTSEAHAGVQTGGSDNTTAD